MTSVTIGGVSSSYDYNGDGVRVSKTVAGVTTNYVQDVASALPVVLQDGTYSYVYGSGLISLTDGSGTQAYRLTDGLGSTTELLDGSGNVIVSYTYDAFGAIRTQSVSNGNDWLFTGEQRDDESGYDFLRARYYDAGVGRFIGRDSSAPDFLNPLGLNRFVFAMDNPANMVDPSGLYPVYICSGAECNVFAFDTDDPVSVITCLGDDLEAYQGGEVGGYETCGDFYDDFCESNGDTCEAIDTTVNQYCASEAARCANLQCKVLGVDCYNGRSLSTIVAYCGVGGAIGYYTGGLAGGIGGCLGGIALSQLPDTVADILRWLGFP
jgi:RHS repeat-associated protein